MTKENSPQQISSLDVSAGKDGVDRRQLLKGTAAMALAGLGMTSVQAQQGGSVQVQELGLVGAARAIRNGEISSESYASTLLARARAHADLKAFITIDEAGVLEAARAADKARAAGKSGPLLGVPIGVKDSYFVRGLPATIGTSVLNGYKPSKDAQVVRSLKDAGAIVFGKNNLVEMSFGLTGHNAHHGQVKNPYNKAHITGGSSSGAASSVAARILPAALGGDTVGSIRLPASLCGVVGFKPSLGRWSLDGVAPISSTLDVAGVLARSVDDCQLMDAIATQAATSVPRPAAGLKGVRLAVAPKLFLDEIDPTVEKVFKETLYKLKDAGATIVEVDFGADFRALVEGTTWPIFFHETMPEVREYLAKNGLPVTFEQIYEGLGSPIKGRWARFVVPNAPNYFSDETYKAVMEKRRPEIIRRYSQLVFNQADALLFPTTPCAAPAIENQWSFMVAGKQVQDTFLPRNTHIANVANLPGISLPMGAMSDGLPFGLEMDAATGGDTGLLVLASRVEQVLGKIAAPSRL